MFVSLFYGENMKLFLALILSSFAVTAFAGEAPVASEPTVASAKECDSCGSSSSNCRVRRGLFGRRYFTRSTECASDKTGSTYSRSWTVTDGCDNVLRSRTFSRTICKGDTCNKCECK